MIFLKNTNCHICSSKLGKDEVALNKKLLGRNVKYYFCIRCLADYLSCTEDDLLIKIEEFKEQGCTLFN